MGVEPAQLPPSASPQEPWGQSAVSGAELVTPALSWPGAGCLSLLLGQGVTFQAPMTAHGLPGAFLLGFDSYAKALTALLAPIIQCEHRCVGKHIGAIC